MSIIPFPWLILVVLMVSSIADGFRCDRRPYGSTTQASAADGRFKLVLAGAETSYIPDQAYTVQLTATDDDSRFTSFMISAEGDMKSDPKNPRRMMLLFPGEIRPQTPSTAKFSDRCLYSVEQAINSAKSSVEIYWQAPASGNGCVTLRAMVAENEETWYEDGAPLTKRLCEDLRQPDDVAPQVNYECGACDEAKYEISFTGIWSRNTHYVLYPENDWVPRFSDMVGASHATDFILWSPGSLASDGLKDLAEHANSSQFESEIKAKIGDGVRTLIKGKGHGYHKMSNPSYAFFRADKVNHLITAAIGLYPSPDWFLGVTRFELCGEDSSWLQERELNLYPWDAGTDSGVSYESANLPTYPQDAVARVQMSSYDKNSPFYETDMKDLHPFGKLHIKLIRTYHKECEDSAVEGETPAPEENGGEEETPEGPEGPSRYQNQAASAERRREGPIERDPESPEDCPMSQWLEWSSCEGICQDGVVRGYRWRERYHLVNGVAVEKYDPDTKPSHKKATVPEYCKKNFEDFERSECEDDCTEDRELTVERRIMKPISPGHGWSSKREVSDNTEDDDIKTAEYKI